jgi:hypothetical protein
MAFPMAKTIAIKDACDSFGRIFGSDLNRKDIMNYDLDLTLITLDESHPNWNKVIEAIKSKQYSVEQIKEKYNMSKEIEHYLLSIQNK